MKRSASSSPRSPPRRASTPTAPPGRAPAAAVLPAVARLDEITGCGPTAATAIIAEIGLDITAFGTPGRPVSLAKRSPPTRQCGKNRAGRFHDRFGGQRLHERQPGRLLRQAVQLPARVFVRAGAE